MRDECDNGRRERATTDLKKWHTPVIVEFDPIRATRNNAGFGTDTIIAGAAPATGS